MKTTTYGTNEEVIDLEVGDTHATLRITEAPGLLGRGAYITNANARALALALAEFAGLALADAEPAPFKENARFEDIRKGDLVRTTTTYSNGTVETTEGLVDHLAYRTAWDGCETSLYDEIDSDDPRVTLTILSRPEREWKPGDLALDAEDRVWRMDEDGEWNEPGTAYYYSCTAALERDYGPLRRAKVVEVEQ